MNNQITSQITNCPIEFTLKGDLVAITSIRFTPADPFAQDTGLIGFVSLLYGLVVLRGITVRRTRDGQYRLSFPVRKDQRCSTQDLIQPVNNSARELIEAVVFQELRRRGVLPPAAE